MTGDTMLNEKTVNKIVYFVRHGQTVSNIFEKTQGPDDHLSEVGLRQADVVAERAKTIDFECIITSDYSRAKVTAEKIHKVTGRPIESSGLFREIRRPTEFLGRIVKEDNEVLAGYKLINENFGNKDWHFSDEENFYDVSIRGREALKYLLARNEQKILVVSHGNFLRSLLGIMLRGESYSYQDYIDIESTFELDNTSITMAEYKHHWRKNDNTWMIKSWNDSVHLGEIK
jgi:probable phosphoglycerate mutase